MLEITPINSLITQNKRHSKSDKERYSKTYADRNVFNYMERSSKFDKLYDFMDIEEQRVFSANGDTFIVAKEAPTHNNWPAYRMFLAQADGTKKHLGSVLDYGNGRYRLYGAQGEVPFFKESMWNDLEGCVVDDKAMSGIAPNMQKIDKHYYNMINGGNIDMVNTKEPFFSWHGSFIDNFSDMIKEIIGYHQGGDVDKDVILNFSEHSKEDLSAEGLMKSGLLEQGKFGIYQGRVLEINTDIIQGTVPIFNKVVPDIKENGPSLKIDTHLKGDYDPRYQYFLNESYIREMVQEHRRLLTEQESTFLKAISRYLSELNKKVPKQLNLVEMFERAKLPQLIKTLK